VYISLLQPYALFVKIFFSKIPLFFFYFEVSMILKGKPMTTDFEHPDYEKFTSIDQVETEIVIRKENLVRKDLLERRIKDEKKSYNQAINEQLKEVKEEREHEMGVIGALEDRKKVLHVQSKIVPFQKSQA
jgi:hypothetical protein